MAEKLLTKARIVEVLDILKGLYPGARCALDFRNTFELLIAVTLSAQTTDKSVNKVTPVLFEKWRDAESLSLADPLAVMDTIKSIGMYRQKSANIIGLSAMLCEEYGGEVPCDMDELMKLPGVGRKTANVVLSVGFSQQRIAVDTHVFRVANRLGLCAEDSPEKTELALMARIPQKRWSESHHLLIWHGREICAARKPRCEECPANKLCLYRNK